MDELKPILEELTREPIAFLGGFVSGLLKLSLNDDPIKTWIEKQGEDTYICIPEGAGYPVTRESFRTAKRAGD